MTASVANGLAEVISVILSMIQILVIGSVIISWVNADPSNQIVQIIHRLTEPLYRPIRRFTGGLGGPIDWAPMVIILLIIFLKFSLVPYLKGIARTGL